MQRPIKFRAWDNLKKRMMGIVDELRFAHNEGSEENVVAGDGQSQHFTLMQFTGLKDKAGEEIYEGDILWQGDRGSKYNGGIGVVEFATENSVGHPINGYWAKVSSDEAFTIYPKHVEVIGNIYENPELLS